MKTYPMPKSFDGEKFAARYGLRIGLDADFWSEGGLLYVPDNLPDDPPIFEAPDPPKPRIGERLDAVRTLPELIAVLKEELSHGSAVIGGPTDSPAGGPNIRGN